MLNGASGYAENCPAADELRAVQDQQNVAEELGQFPIVSGHAPVAAPGQPEAGNQGAEASRNDQEVVQIRDEVVPGGLQLRIGETAGIASRYKPSKGGYLETE